MSETEKNKLSLRKIQAAVASFNEARDQLNAAIEHMNELHKAATPLMEEIKSAPNNTPFLYVKSEHILPIHNSPLIIRPGISKEDLRVALDIIQNELIRAEAESDRLLGILEGRYRHLQNLSKKGGITA